MDARPEKTIYIEKQKRKWNRYIEKLRTIVKKISNWKVPSNDGNRGLCFLRFPDINERLV